MDIKKVLSEAGAAKEQISQFEDYQRAGNKKGQERILCRCKRQQEEKLRDKQRQLCCLDYMIEEVKKNK